MDLITDTLNRGDKSVQVIIQRYLEIPCVAILNKQKCLFFKNSELEGKTGSVWEMMVPVGGEGYKGRV
jgi:hypothetical protein